MAVLGSILAFLSALAPIVGPLLLQWMAARNAAPDTAAQAQGVAIEAAAVTAHTAQLETAVAQAEAAAPTTEKALVDELNAGQF